MLTPNFLKIISVILEQSRNNTLEQRSAEELRSVGLMLLGYLRLINTDFSTPADSAAPKESYFAELKRVLNLITTSQSKRLEIIKKELSVAFNSDCRSIIRNIEELEAQLLLDKDQQHRIGILKNSLKDLSAHIEETLLLPHIGLLESTRYLIQQQASLNEQIRSIKPVNSTPSVEQLIPKTMTHHLKVWTHWIEVEHNNQQCITYGSCSELIDLCL